MRNKKNKLENFIKDKFYLEIYEDIEAKPETFACEPLEFFQLLDETVKFIKQNLNNPLAIRSRLNDHFPNKPYFLKKLDEKLQQIIAGDGLSLEERRMNEVADMLTNENEKLSEALEIIRHHRINIGDFQAILESLKNIPQIDDKIDFLTDTKAKAIKKDFIEQCSLEIAKLKETKQLDTMPKPEIDEIIKHPDLTLDRAVLFFYYLFKHSKANCTNTTKAKAISFLTGFSENTIRQKLSNPHSKDNEKSFSAYQTDIKIVRKHFNNLGLSEIVKMIDNDIKD